MADSFLWYELMTGDLDKAAAFYSAVVGWQIRDFDMPGPTYKIFSVQGHDIGGMMSWTGAGQPGKRPEWMGHIHTSHLDEELKAVEADGGSILKPAQDIPHVGRFAVVADPRGARYLLFEPEPSRTPAQRLGLDVPGNVGWHELIFRGDLESQFDYYAKHYGWQKDKAHDMGPMGVYQTLRMGQPMQNGGMMSMDAVPDLPPDFYPHWHYYFVVEDIDAAVRRIEQAGGTLRMGPMAVPGGSRILQGIDDQGCEFALVQPAPSA